MLGPNKAFYIKSVHEADRKCAHISYYRSVQQTRIFKFSRETFGRECGLMNMKCTKKIIF